MSAHAWREPALPPPFAGAWAWLFPITYLVHILEEYGAGEGFPAWLSRMAEVSFTPNRFLLLNTLLWLCMVAAVRFAQQRPSQAWLLVGLGALVLINGFLHLAGTLLTHSYSPGLISGTLLWFPLGVFTLERARRGLPRSALAAGVGAALAAQVLISLLALNIGRLGT